MPPSGRWLAGQLVEPEHVFPVENSTPYFGGWQQKNARVTSHDEENIQKSLSIKLLIKENSPNSSDVSAPSHGPTVQYEDRCFAF
jgi:hypothetical protein